MGLRIPPGLGRTILFKNESGDLQTPEKKYDYINHDTWINENKVNPKHEVSKHPDFMNKLASMEPGKFVMEIAVGQKVEKATFRGIIQEDASVSGGSPSFMFKTSDGETHWIHISTMYQSLM